MTSFDIIEFKIKKFLEKKNLILFQVKLKENNSKIEITKDNIIIGVITIANH
jgi:hypothetical protein